MKKILIIEDEQAIVEITTIILEEEGYEVYSISDCSQVYRQLSEIIPDLILLDINLSGFDGKEICGYIKSYDKLKRIPVLMMSANMNLEQISRECGADGMIKKPFDVTHLAQTVAKHID